MRLVVTDGTAHRYEIERHVELFRNDSSQSAGKTGTAEYCDDIANEQENASLGRGHLMPGMWAMHPGMMLKLLWLLLFITALKERRFQRRSFVV